MIHKYAIHYPILIGLLLVSALLLTPFTSSAEKYAYVDAQGGIKTVEAVDWMSAIAGALNIHINSGVMLLTSEEGL